MTTPATGNPNRSATPGAAPRGDLRLHLSEVFGPTIQGEGLSLGTPAMFVRTAGCPLACTWCDTAYSWDWSRYDRDAETRTASADEVWAEVEALAAGTAVRTLVLTGGEPLTQHRALAALARLARESGWRVEVETSGSLLLGDLDGHVDLVTVSLKLASSGNHTKRRLREHVIANLAERRDVAWKFVVDTDYSNERESLAANDQVEVDALVDRYALSPVFVMAQATTAESVIYSTRFIVDWAVRRGYRITPRLHTLLWGEERGR